MNWEGERDSGDRSSADDFRAIISGVLVIFEGPEGAGETRSWETPGYDVFSAGKSPCICLRGVRISRRRSPRVSEFCEKLSDCLGVFGS